MLEVPSSCICLSNINLHMASLIVGAMPNSERIVRVYNRVQLSFQYGGSCLFVFFLA